MKRAQNAYKFMLLFLAEKYVKEANPSKNYNSLQEIFLDFNTENNFSKDKCELLPFLVTIGNGKKTELLEIFSPFTIYKDLGFKSLLLETFFQVSEDFRLNNHSLNINYDSFGSDILSLKTMSNYIVSSDDDSLNKIVNKDIIHISKSINNIIDFKIPNFASLQLELISYWNKRNYTYRYNESYFNKDGVVIEGINMTRKQLLQHIDFNIATEIFDIQSGINESIDKAELLIHTANNYTLVHM